MLERMIMATGVDPANATQNDLVLIGPHSFDQAQEFWRSHGKDIEDVANMLRAHWERNAKKKALSRNTLATAHFLSGLAVAISVIEHKHNQKMMLEVQP